MQEQVEAREKFEKQREEDLRKKLFDNKSQNKPGYGANAIICPLCKGDGGVRSVQDVMEPVG